MAEDARKLSGILRRLVPFLRETGIEVEPPAETDKTRTWHIRAVGTDIPPDRPEPPDGNPLKTQPLGGVGGLGGSLHAIGGDDPCSTASLTDPPLPISCKIPPKPPEPPDATETINITNGIDFGRSPGGSPTGMVARSAGYALRPLRRARHR
jgi:hypothetical protein